MTANFDVNSRKNFIGEDKILRIYTFYMYSVMRKLINFL